MKDFLKNAHNVVKQNNKQFRSMTRSEIYKELKLAYKQFVSDFQPYNI